MKLKPHPSIFLPLYSYELSSLLNYNYLFTQQLYIMKKTFFALSAASLALMTSCQNEAQESVLTLADEVIVSFGMDLGISDAELTRAEHNFEYYIAISSDEATEDGTITSGYVGRFTSLLDASLALKVGTEYTFYVSAFESLGDEYSLASLCEYVGEFAVVTEPVSYAPAFADKRVDRYYGTVTKTIEANTTINIEGKHFAYGILVDIEKPSFGHVKLAAESPALSYDVASTASEGVVMQNIFCLGGTDLGGSKTLTATVTMYDNDESVLSSVSKEITIERNHNKTLKIYAVNPLTAIDFTTEDRMIKDTEEDMTPAGTHMNGTHEYVDLGLTTTIIVNGEEKEVPIYWATCNIGAEKPEDNGLYFAWGETTGYTSDTNDGRIFDWEAYQWCNGSKYTITKYNATDGKTVLDPEDDAATYNWKGSWRMPTTEEFVNLFDRCTWRYDNVKNGWNVKGTTGNSIFLPKCGVRNSRGLDMFDSYYWTSKGGTEFCSVLQLYSNERNMWSCSRSDGCGIRPVCVLAE